MTIAVLYISVLACPAAPTQLFLLYYDKACTGWVVLQLLYFCTTWWVGGFVGCEWVVKWVVFRLLSACDFVPFPAFVSISCTSSGCSSSSILRSAILAGSGMVHRTFVLNCWCNTRFQLLVLWSMLWCVGVYAGVWVKYCSGYRELWAPKMKNS